MTVHIAAMLAEAAVLILGPIVLWSLVTRRTGLGRHGWALIGYGGFFFIMSQIVNTLPRFGVIQAGVTEGAAFVILFALISGLGEEGSRWIAMRYVGQIRERLDRPSAIAYGLGHGGFESVIIGLALLATALPIANATDPASVASLTAAQVAQAAEIARTPVWVFLAGAIERGLAIGLHVGLSLVVATAVLRRAPRYLIAAILWHASVNAASVGVKAATGSVALTELVVLIGALGALAYGLRISAAAESLGTSVGDSSAVTVARS